ncbi:MAG: twin-arginine translocase subunit TatC [Ignavibacteriae bacterium]|nr:twin-arginine translocase subunit TatC [Ignavibacteriota bacterium]
MSFLDHLEELRWRIIYTLLGIVIGSAVVWAFKDFLMEDVLLRPAKENHLQLQNLRPFGQLFLYMQVSLFGGIILSIPNILLQIWLFVSPGLYPHERKYIRWIVVFSSFCFLAGVAFAYFVILPAAFSFFVSFGTPLIENNISIDEYFNFILNLMLGAGLVFELPMVSAFLARLGILTPQFMRKYWRHAVIIILIVAAFLTPTPDPYNMLLLAIPMVGLYEISIWIAKLVSRKKRRAQIAEEHKQDPS